MRFVASGDSDHTWRAIESYGLQEYASMINFALFRSAPARLLFVGLAVFAVYARHFDNSFHFDDSHSVEQNPHIRTLSNISTFFFDATTFSVLPLNQSYRPVVTASLAVDYWLGGGLVPFYFHLSTFCWFIVQLSLMYLFFTRILSLASPGEQRGPLAAFIVAWYGLHPVTADTVNYIIQRGDLYATLGVVAGFAAFQYLPRWRPFGFYLVPVALGALAKPTAIMFGPLLFFYVLLIEDGSDLCFWRRGFAWSKVAHALRVAMPSLLTCAALYLLQARMTPDSFTPGGSSLTRYLCTQPFVHLYYAVTLVFPTQLTVDTDWELLPGYRDPRALLGFAFYLVLVGMILWSSRLQQLRPVAFGLLWFILALVPTTVVPLAEVMNDHRMFFPFVGLMLSVCWAGYRLIHSYASSRNTFAAVALLALPVYGYGAFQRNEVWHSEESLWLDATIKSPKNGRGLMNYGLTQMAKGSYARAIDYFKRAEQHTPHYSTLQVNLGIAFGASGEDATAEKHFQRALTLGPQTSARYFYYARWLALRGRNVEALHNLALALEHGPSDLKAHHLQLELLERQQEWSKVRQTAAAIMRLVPEDAQARAAVTRADLSEQQLLTSARELASATPPSEVLVNLSLQLFRAGKYEECIEVAQRAAVLNPKSVQAFTNIGAAAAALSQWPRAIEAAESALRIDPNFELAKNNLMWARSQLKREASDSP